MSIRIMSPQARTTSLSVMAAAGLVLILAAVAIPGVAGDDQSVIAGREETARVMATVNDLALALERFRRDTQQAPTGFRGRASYAWLHGEGAPPRFLVRPDGMPGRLAWFLSTNEMGARAWQGPYATRIGPDPWGRCYLALIDRAGVPARITAIISAGPNGVVETRAAARMPAGDDIGIVLR